MEQAPRPRPLVAGPLVRSPLLPRALRQLGRARPLVSTPPLLPRAVDRTVPPVDLAAALDRREAGGDELVLARRQRSSGPTSTRERPAASAGSDSLNDQEWYTRMAGHLRAKQGAPVVAPKPVAPAPAKKVETDAEWYERMRVAMQTKRDRIQAERDAAADRLAAAIKAVTPEPTPKPEVDPEAEERAREAARQAAFRRAALGSVALARHAHAHDSAAVSEASAVAAPLVPPGAPAPEEKTASVGDEPNLTPPPPSHPREGGVEESDRTAWGAAREGGDESASSVPAVASSADERRGEDVLSSSLPLPADGKGAGGLGPAPDLTIGEEAREYQSADGAPVTADDRSRLDAIGARAVAICERELGALLSVATRRMIGLVEVEIDLDLTKLTDDEAAEAWGRELARAVRARLRRAE